MKSHYVCGHHKATEKYMKLLFARVVIGKRAISLLRRWKKEMVLLLQFASFLLLSSLHKTFWITINRPHHLMTMASPSPPQSAPPAPCWPFQRMSRRVSVLSLSVAVGILAYAATGAAQSKPGMSRFFTARALRRVGPAVVRIDKVHIQPIGGSLAPVPDDRPDSDPFFPDPFFQQFFNQRRHQNDLGAGVVFTEEGLILTTAQTVERMD